MPICIGSNSLGPSNDDMQECGGDTPLQICLAEGGKGTLAEGVRLVYHHDMGTVAQSEADIDALMAATGLSVGRPLGTGHASWGGVDPARLAGTYRQRIFHVHAKDVRAETGLA